MFVLRLSLDEYLCYFRAMISLNRVMSKQATVDDNPAGIRWIKG